MSYSVQLIKRFLLIICMIGPLALSAQNTAKTPEKFASQVVECMLKRKCENFYQFFADTLVWIDTKEVWFKSDHMDDYPKLCESALVGDTMNLAYYEENFDHVIYKSKDFVNVKKLNEYLAQSTHYTIQKNDYLFIGNVYKKGKADEIITPSSFMFIFRQEGKVFRIVVMPWFDPNPKKKKK